MIDLLDRVPDIKALLDIHQFRWMIQAPGYYRPINIQEFYSCYATNLLNSVGGRSQGLKK